MQFAARNFALEGPDILQHQWLLFFIVFITNHIAGIGSGNLKERFLYIGNELAAGNFRKSNFDSFFLLNFIIFALCRNAPAVQSFDPALGVERDPNDAVVTSAGTKNLVNPSDVGLDFVGGLDVDGFFSVEQHGI